MRKQMPCAGRRSNSGAHAEEAGAAGWRMISANAGLIIHIIADMRLRCLFIQSSSRISDILRLLYQTILI